MPTPGLRGKAIRERDLGRPDLSSPLELVVFEESVRLGRRRLARGNCPIILLEKFGPGWISWEANGLT